MPSVQERQKGLAGNNEYMTGGVILKFKPRVLVQGSLYVFHFVKMLKGNMHHKYDVSLKVAFYTIDLAAGIFFLKIKIYPALLNKMIDAKRILH